MAERISPVILRILRQDEPILMPCEPEDLLKRSKIPVRHESKVENHLAKSMTIAELFHLYLHHIRDQSNAAAPEGNPDNNEEHLKLFPLCGKPSVPDIQEKSEHASYLNGFHLHTQKK